MATYVRKEYIESDEVKKAQSALAAQQEAKPGDYSSRWQSQLDTLLAGIRNRPDFRYDPGSDALYRQYRDQYVRLGKQAMMDTMGQAAALTGGYGNSYAETAGQQAYQGYLQGLNSALPELYRLALERYQAEGDQLKDRYDTLLRQEQLDYGKYQDSLERWSDEQNRLYQKWLKEREFDYGIYSDREDAAYDAYRDQVADQQWQQQFQYQQSQDELAYQQWLKEFEEERRQFDLQWQLQQAAAAAKGASGSRSSGGTTAKKKDTAEDQEAKTFVENMLKNATGSRFDPQRVISGTNALNQNQKATAQEYLSQLLAQGYMK